MRPLHASLGIHAEAVTQELNGWLETDRVARLWREESSLWTGQDENRWLGWLRIAETESTQLARYQDAADDVRTAGFTDAVVLGMGGSSLCPDVLRRTFGPQKGYPRLHVVDSMVPAQVREVRRQIDPRTTLFLVASKSGSTIEPNVLLQFFYDEVSKAVGPEHAGEHFIAVTDPGTKMQATAEQMKFRRVYFGLPEIGGRYSALSKFGMVPAAVMGLNVGRLLKSAQQMSQECQKSGRGEQNPGIELGCILGVMTRVGRDKVTLITSPGISTLGGWLEQLLAESLGKKGQGLIPIDGEQLGPAELYGQDRLFVYVRLTSAPSATQEAAVAALKAAGHPVVQIDLDHIYDLGGEFLRWEIATAVAGAVLKIHPFDQPDVEAAKIAARALMAEYEKAGQLKGPPVDLQADGQSVTMTSALKTQNSKSGQSGGLTTVVQALAALLRTLQPGDYFAINAYVDMNEAHARPLENLRLAVRNQKRVATTLGFGPRFLHSTGQLHKGGPNNGVFLQITADDAHDLAIPGQKFSFGILKQAQATGDFAVLEERGRRAIHLHLGADVETALHWLSQQVAASLSG